VIAALPLVVAAATAEPVRAASARPLGGPFDEAALRARARDLAARPYQAASDELPPSLAKLDYDEYRDIRFDPAQSLWKKEGLPFQLQFFHRGFYFHDKVELFELQGGRAIPIAYSPRQFNFKRGAPAGLKADLGFAGFRIHTRLNRPDYFDEVAVFLGASYFRAVAKGLVYGLSARGLAINTGAAEEFPIFRTFWIERPAPGAAALKVLALMDSPSCSGAFSFLITPGATTVFDVAARIYPRKDMATVGVAPLTSMYLYGNDAARRFDDFRPRVHDSDGLEIVNGGGEHLWRPLSNPTRVQTSAFQDSDPQSFGLLQRERRFDAYEDLEARYEMRPDLRVEPHGGWGPGEVRLVELPAKTEYEDNIAAFWTPAAPLRAGTEAKFDYRLHWGPAQPPPAGLASIVQTRSGAGTKPGWRRFVLEFALPNGLGVDMLRPQVSTTTGRLYEVVLHPNPETRGARLSFELDPAGARTAELRALLVQSGKPVSEVWLYRWIA